MTQTKIHISHLKEQLRTAENQERSRILVKIETLKTEGEHQIRLHQKDVDFQTKEYTTELAVQKYSDGLEDESNELFVPDYQREFTWSEKRQSKLIESLLMGLPIPYIFIADISSDDPEFDARTEIVDGSQRIRTLHAFLKKGLILTDLKLLTNLNGFQFNDLPISRQRRFKRLPLRIIELSSQCTEDTRRDLFERINTGSDILKDMEVRKGSELGSTTLYTEVITPCSALEKFKTLAPLSESVEKRDERKEFTLRFFAYYQNYQHFGHSVRDFLNEYMESQKAIGDREITRMNAEFEAMLSFVAQYFPHGFTKTEKAKTTPRVRFEAIAVGAALALQENPGVKPSNVDWLFSDEFKQHTTSDGSNSKPKVKARIEYVRDKLLE
ncbi:MAG: DUF262 domain-containing protein, partial [Methyloprofundus sp.]|nr:DUF262 domain-containing protein [Methyloprofundus sp.]